MTEETRKETSKRKERRRVVVVAMVQNAEGMAMLPRPTVPIKNTRSKKKEQCSAEGRVNQ
jgi:hypothetical protein